MEVEEAGVEGRVEICINHRTINNRGGNHYEFSIGTRDLSKTSGEGIGYQKAKGTQSAGTQNSIIEEGVDEG